MQKSFQLAALVSILFSTSALANGFYLGGGFGPQAINFDQSGHIVIRNGTTIQENINDDTNLSGTGMYGTFFGGYEWIYQRCYGAAEANINTTWAEFTSDNLEYVHSNFNSAEYSFRNSYGISILPGYFVAPSTLLYGRLGYSNTEFLISSTESTLPDFNKHLSGFRFGLGIKEYCTCHWGFRLEYSQILYQFTKNTIVSGPATKTTKISPMTGLVELGIIYNF